MYRELAMCNHYSMYLTYINTFNLPKSPMRAMLLLSPLFRLKNKSKSRVSNFAQGLRASQSKNKDSKVVNLALESVLLTRKYACLISYSTAYIEKSGSLFNMRIM